MPRGRLAGAVLALLLALGVAPAAAQAVIGQSECRGSYQGIDIAGTVLADLWKVNGPDSGSTLGTFNTIYEHLMYGEMAQIAGMVRLFGHMRDAAGNLVNFEVFLQGGGEGTGSVWINGARHRETFMRFVLGRLSFDIYPETGGLAHFTCDYAGETAQ